MVDIERNCMNRKRDGRTSNPSINIDEQQEKMIDIIDLMKNEIMITNFKQK